MSGSVSPTGGAKASGNGSKYAILAALAVAAGIVAAVMLLSGSDDGSDATVASVESTSVEVDGTLALTATITGAIASEGRRLSLETGRDLLQTDMVTTDPTYAGASEDDVNFIAVFVYADSYYGTSAETDEFLTSPTACAAAGDDCTEHVMLKIGNTWHMIINLPIGNYQMLASARTTDDDATEVFRGSAPCNIQANRRTSVTIVMFQVGDFQSVDGNTLAIISYFNVAPAIIQQDESITVEGEALDLDGDIVYTRYTFEAQYDSFSDHELNVDGAVITGATGTTGWLATEYDSMVFTAGIDTCDEYSSFTIRFFMEATDNNNDNDVNQQIIGPVSVDSTVECVEGQLDLNIEFNTAPEFIDWAIVNTFACSGADNSACTADKRSDASDDNNAQQGTQAAENGWVVNQLRGNIYDFEADGMIGDGVLSCTLGNTDDSNDCAGVEIDSNTLIRDTTDPTYHFVSVDVYTDSNQCPSGEVCTCDIQCVITQDDTFETELTATANNLFQFQSCIPDTDGNCRELEFSPLYQTQGSYPGEKAAVSMVRFTQYVEPLAAALELQVYGNDNSAAEFIVLDAGNGYSFVSSSFSATAVPYNHATDVTSGPTETGWSTGSFPNDFRSDDMTWYITLEVLDEESALELDSFQVTVCNDLDDGSFADEFCTSASVEFRDTSSAYCTAAVNTYHMACDGDNNVLNLDTSEFPNKLGSSSNDVLISITAPAGYINLVSTGISTSMELWDMCPTAYGAGLMDSTAYSSDESSLSSFTSGEDFSGDDFFYVVSSDTEGVEGTIELTLQCYDYPTYNYPVDILSAVTVGETWNTYTSDVGYSYTCETCSVLVENGCSEYIVPISILGFEVFPYWNYYDCYQNQECNCDAYYSGSCTMMNTEEFDYGNCQAINANGITYSQGSSSGSIDGVSYYTQSSNEGTVLYTPSLQWNTISTEGSLTYGASAAQSASQQSDSGDVYCSLRWNGNDAWATGGNIMRIFVSGSQANANMGGADHMSHSNVWGWAYQISYPSSVGITGTECQDIADFLGIN
jgi:hypothetical protein